MLRNLIRVRNAYRTCTRTCFFSCALIQRGPYDVESPQRGSSLWVLLQGNEMVRALRGHNQWAHLCSLSRVANHCDVVTSMPTRGMRCGHPQANSGRIDVPCAARASWPTIATWCQSSSFRQGNRPQRLHSICQIDNLFFAAVQRNNTRKVHKVVTMGNPKTQCNSQFMILNLCMVLV